MSKTYIQNGGTEPIIVDLFDSDEQPITGAASDIEITIRNTANDDFYNGTVFSSTPATLTPTEIDDVDEPGYYQYLFTSPLNDITCRITAVTSNAAAVRKNFGPDLLQVGGTQVSASVVSLINNAITAASLASDAVAEIATGVDDKLSDEHGEDSWEGGGGGEVSEDITSLLETLLSELQKIALPILSVSQVIGKMWLGAKGDTISKPLYRDGALESGTPDEGSVKMLFEKIGSDEGDIVVDATFDAGMISYTTIEGDGAFESVGRWRIQGLATFNDGEETRYTEDEIRDVWRPIES